MAGSLALPESGYVHFPDVLFIRIVHRGFKAVGFHLDFQFHPVGVDLVGIFQTHV